MTTLQVKLNLPEKLVKDAKAEGLLTPRIKLVVRRVSYTNIVVSAFFRRVRTRYFTRIYSFTSKPSSVCWAMKRR